MSDTTIGILATAHYLPKATKSIEEIFRDEEIPNEPLAADIDFQRDIGIEKVHLGGDETPSEIGLKAARRAIDKAGIDPADLDLILDFTSIPEDYVAPTWSAAGVVQHELGARHAFATAVNTGGCASYHVALKAACAMMRDEDSMQLALLFSGDKTPALNKTYYPITVTCDGGGAVILKKGHDRDVILAVEVATLGELHDIWYIPGIANREEGAAPQQHLHMKSDMRRFKKAVVPVNIFMFRKVMRAAVKRAGLKWKDVDYYIYPTFSRWDQRSFCTALRIDPESVYTESLVRHGHLQENDMVINYEDAVDEGRVKKGDIVMVTTNGAGFAWGAAVIRH